MKTLCKLQKQVTGQSYLQVNRSCKEKRKGKKKTNPKPKVEVMSLLRESL